MQVLLVRFTAKPSLPVTALADVGLSSNMDSPSLAKFSFGSFLKLFTSALEAVWSTSIILAAGDSRKSAISTSSSSSALARTALGCKDGLTGVLAVVLSGVGVIGALGNSEALLGALSLSAWSSLLAGGRPMCQYSHLGPLGQFPYSGQFSGRSPEKEATIGFDGL